MISASSSAAAGLVTGYFGVGASSGNSFPTVGGSSGSPDYVLGGSLGTASSPFAFLSNAIFGEVTENLLRDPLANGAITGTASAQVEKLIGELSRGGARSVQSGGGGSLPAGGVLA